MTIYVSPKALDDVRAGKASTMSVSTNPLAIPGAIKLITQESVEALSAMRTAAALESLAKSVEALTEKKGGKGK